MRAHRVDHRLVVALAEDRAAGDEGVGAGGGGLRDVVGLDAAVDLEQHFAAAALAVGVEALAKLQAARARIDAWAQASGRTILLEVDGGVKVDNIAQIAAAGADTFVAGSAIFGARDYAATIAAMRREIERGLAQRTARQAERERELYSPGGA